MKIRRILIIALLCHASLTMASTSLVKDIGPGSSNPQNFTNCRGVVFFTVDKGEGSELWKTDATTPGTLKLRAFGNNYNKPREFACGGDLLFFSAFNKNRRATELWTSSGTPTSTRRITDIEVFRVATGLNQQIVFESYTSQTGYELWRSDGTAEGTRLLKDINPGKQTGFSTAQFRKFNNQLYFVGNDGTHGPELWRTDGTRAGTVMVKDVKAGPIGSFPQHLVVARNTLFFVASGGHGFDLWKSDGTRSGTRIVKDFNFAPTSSGIKFLVGTERLLYFYASDTSSPWQLWKSNGTKNGTLPLKPVSLAFVPAEVGGRIFFVSGSELWTSSGSFETTVLVKKINPSPFGVWIYSIKDLNGIAVFTADDGRSGYEPWRSNGKPDGTYRLRDINPGGAPSSPFPLVRYRNWVLFGANDGVHGKELWKTDGN